MPIKFNCPKCGKRIGVPESMAGKRGNCPGCSSPVVVPSSPAPPPARAAQGQKTDYSFRLSDEERARIEEEERVRAEARIRAEAEARSKALQPVEAEVVSPPRRGVLDVRVSHRHAGRNVHEHRSTLGTGIKLGVGLGCGLLLVIGLVLVAGGGMCAKVTHDVAQKMDERERKREAEEAQKWVQVNWRLDNSVIEENKFLDSDRGRAHVGVWIEVENHGYKEVTVNPLYFSLEADGARFGTEFRLVNPRLQHVSLKDGAKASGGMAFEVPDATKQVSLIYKPMSFSQINVKYGKAPPRSDD